MTDMMPHKTTISVTGLSAVSTLALLIACGRVGAAQWYVEPRASLETFYDDNVRLAERHQESTFGASIDAGFMAGKRTEITDLAIGMKLSSSRYTETSDLDRTDGSVSFAGGYQLGRSRLGLDAGFDYDSTLTSEQATSGLVQTNKRRKRLVVTPSWKYELSPRSIVEVAFDHEDVTYEDAESIPLYDYTFDTLSLKDTYALDERTKLIGRFGYANYQSDQVSGETESLSAELGANYLLSETSSVTAFAGLRHSREKVPSVAGSRYNDSDGPLFEISYRKRFERGTLSLGAERSLLPSSDGGLLDTTGLSLAFQTPLSERWDVGVDARAYRNRNLDASSPGGSGDDRDYLELSPTIKRRLTEALSLDVSYHYRWQSRDSEADDAISNAVFLTLTYVPPRESVERWSLFDKE